MAVGILVGSFVGLVVDIIVGFFIDMTLGIFVGVIIVELSRCALWEGSRCKFGMSESEASGFGASVVGTFVVGASVVGMSVGRSAMTSVCPNFSAAASWATQIDQSGLVGNVGDRTVGVVEICGIGVGVVGIVGVV